MYISYHGEKKKKKTENLAKAILKKLSAITGYYQVFYPTEPESSLPNFGIPGQDN